jgi:hypothetical protein
MMRGPLRQRHIGNVEIEVDGFADQANQRLGAQISGLRPDIVNRA